MKMTKAPRRAEAFIVTKEHRRFAEFANVVRKERYIGLCYGPAGVGKTQSARRYAHWQSVEPLLTRWGPRDEADKKVYATLAKSRVLFFTPDVRANLGSLRHQLDEVLSRINICIDQHRGKTERTLPWEYVELVVIDEAERLNTAALEYLRDVFDRNDIGLILIGMPGIEKRMSRYPQLYSRVGFAHHYRPLLGDELSFVLTRHWQKLGLQLDGADFTDAQAVASIARITGGNFRLLRRQTLYRYRGGKEVTRLRIGKDGFTLPIELVTSTQAILARKRSGKSYTASVQAEELLRHKQQIATIDPTGAWWGLRSSAVGDGPGYPVVVFGGDHADAPLEPHAGRMLATALVEHGFSAIFDVGLMLTEDQIRFTSDFASELLRINRTALHLFIDEADTFAPQLTENRGQKVCLGTVSRLVKQGGVRGVGVTMITQRPADINKKVLSQVDILTVLRMSHPLDIKAATDWIKSEVSVEFAGIVESALPSLPVGSAFFCSASLGIGERVEVRERETFNSGATPKPGERQRLPKVLAPIDIEQLGREVADSARHAQENSPEFLRQRIADLERAGNHTQPYNGIELAQLRVEIAKLRPAAKLAAGYALQLREADETKTLILQGLKLLIGKLQQDSEGEPDAVQESPAPQKLPAKAAARSLVIPRMSMEVPDPEPAVATASAVSTSEQKILDALASLEAVGVSNPSKTQLAAFAGYSNPKSGGFAAPVAALIRKGLAESSGGKAMLTAAGRVAANVPSRPATTKELQDRIFHLLGEGERKMLTLLIAAFPESLTRVELAGQAGYSNAKSGGFAAPLARLVELGFVESVRPGVVRGSEMLFLNGKGRGK